MSGGSFRTLSIPRYWAVFGWLVLAIPARSIWQYALAEEDPLQRVLVPAVYTAVLVLWFPLLLNREVRTRLDFFERSISESAVRSGLQLFAGIVMAVLARVVIGQKAIGLLGPVRLAVVLFGLWIGSYPLVLRWSRTGWKLPANDRRAIAVLLIFAAGFVGIGWIESQSWTARGSAELGLIGLMLLASYFILTFGELGVSPRAAGAVLVAAGLIIFSVLALLEGFFRLIPTSIPRYVLDGLPERGEFLQTRLFQYDDAPIAVGKRFQPNLDIDIAGAALDLVAWNSPARFTTLPDPDTLKVKVHFVTDANGFPNQSTLPEDVDVVIAGDSLTAGLEVQQNWPEILGSQTGLAVLNLSVPGLGPIAEKESIRLYGLDRDPSVVIMAYFEGNDLRDAAKYFETVQSGMNLIDRGLAEVSWDRRLVSLTWLRLSASITVRQLKLVSRPVERDESPPVYPLTFEIGGQTMRLSFLDGFISMLLAPREMIDASENFRYATTAILDADRISREAGARFILVYLPAKAHAYGPYVPAPMLDRVTTTVHLLKLEDGLFVIDDQTYGPASVEFIARMDDQRKSIEDFTADNGIEFLDLTPAFQQLAAQGVELYLPLSIHWNEAGHRLAAEVVAEHLADP